RAVVIHMIEEYAQHNGHADLIRERIDGGTDRWRPIRRGPPAIPDSTRTAHALSVPGARLYYDRGGTGPLLLLIGSPMDSSGFTPLAGVLSDRYTVITYDPRGTGSSTSEDTDQDVTPELQADDV